MTRKRLSTGDLRSLERGEAKHLNDNSVHLRNPQVQPLLDRREPVLSGQKALAFGMEPTSPKRLIDLPHGDAGAGQTAYRKIHAFYSLDQPDTAGRVGGSNFTKALPIATMRSSNNKSMYFHVSVYGIGIRRTGGFVLQNPLTDAEIRDLQFEQYFVEAPAGTFVPLSPRFVPSINASQVRVMVHDESGQRFFDADVLGNRSFSLYGWGATVFLLVKQNGYEVDAKNPNTNTPLTGNCGVEDDLVGGRIVGIFTNRTESIQNRTLSIRIDPTQFPGQPRIIPVPPGSRTVQVFANSPVVAPWILDFWYGRSAAASRADVGAIDWNLGQSRTSIIDIPNAPSISIRPTVEAVAVTSFSFVFEVEP